jgi:DNA-binding beta-propeller fold protein YncE
MDAVPFAYPPNGNLMVLADGPDLLVYSGANDQGLWKLLAEDVLIGVGATETHVYALDAGGTLLQYRALNGEELSRLPLDVSPMGMAVSPEGHVAAWTASDLVLVRPGEDPRPVSLGSPRLAAWGPGSASVGVGGGDGTFSAVDPASGAAWGQLPLGGAIRGVCWCASKGGAWAVAHDQQIDFVSGDGQQTVDSIAVGAPVGEVAVSLDGAFLAVVVEDRAVRVYELHGNTSAGDVSFEREIAHIAFGPDAWLGFGFDDGDANRLDLVTGKMTRTQAHPGRGQNAWAMQAQLNHPLLRGARANVAAGGASIAQHVQPKASKSRKKKSSWVPYAIGGVLVVTGGLFCCGAGVGVLAWLGF